MKADTKVAIIGDMLELGEYSVAEHSQILNEAENMNLWLGW